MSRLKIILKWNDFCLWKSVEFAPKICFMKLYLFAFCEAPLPHPPGCFHSQWTTIVALTMFPHGTAFGMNSMGTHLSKKLFIWTVSQVSCSEDMFLSINTILLDHIWATPLRHVNWGFVYPLRCSSVILVFFTWGRDTAHNFMCANCWGPL